MILDNLKLDGMEVFEAFPAGVDEKLEEEDVSSDDSSHVRPEFVAFNWRSSAAEYILHKKMMPDYFRSYVHALASYRGIFEESIDTLRSRLIALSESPIKTSSIQCLMPPNISGMVRNMNNKLHHFDLESLLSERVDLFLVHQNKVRYISSKSREESHQMLTFIFVEGLFLYFLAKFYHSDEFPLKISYYRRSEPVKTCLLYATGCKSIKSALSTYFNLYPDVFYVNSDISLLKLRQSYFDPSFRASLKKFVEEKEQNAKDELNPRELDVITMGTVTSKGEHNSCHINFLQFPNVPPAVLQVQRRSPVPKEGTKVMFKARNTGTPESPSWVVESYKLKGELTPAGGNPPDILEDIPGKIRAILSPRSAIIRFCNQQIEEEAYLNINQACFDGLGCGLGLPLDVYFKKDDSVVFDACRQEDYRGVRYRVCRISYDTSTRNSSNEAGLHGKIENFLGGEPRLTDAPERLVLSVLEWGTSDVILPKFITNLNVLDPIFNMLAESDEAKDEFIIAYERLVRKLLVKMILDHNNKRLMTSSS